MFNEFPKIKDSIDTCCLSFEASLTHQKVLQKIMLILKHPENNCKTLIRFFNDETFEFDEDIVLDIETYYAIVSIDRRS